MLSHVRAFLIVFFFFTPSFILASEFENKIISDIKIAAPPETEMSEIRTQLMSFKGTRFSSKKINALIKSLYLTERFHDIAVHIVPVGQKQIQLSFRFELSKRIETIQFSGNLLFSDITLIRSIDSAENSLLNENTLLADRSALEDLYREAGYFNTKIHVHFFGPVKPHLIQLSYEIKEGAPALVEEFRIDSEGKPKSKELQSLFSIEKRDIYRPRQFREEILNLKKYFLEHRYLSAQILPEITTFNNDKSLVKIYLKIVPGPQFFFEFEGNTEFPEHELLSPLRTFEAAAPRVTVDDILKHIVLLYKQQGFYHAQASYQSYLNAGRNRRLIHFKLDTFEPVKIEKILIQGNRHFDEDFYLDFIHENGPELLLKKRFYENDFETVSRLLTDHLKTKGFLFPKVSLRSLNWDSKKTSVSPELQIEEGPQTRISEIQIAGLQFFSHSDILNRMQLPLKAPLNLFQLELGLKKLADLYAEHGFLKFVIKNAGSEQMIRYSKDFTSAALKLDLQEGPQTKIGNLVFRGALRTRNRVIKRELFFKKGDLWNPQNIQKSENQLLRLGLFSNVKMTPIGGEFKEGETDVLIETLERLPGLTEFGGGFANDDGLRGFAGVAYRNAGGWNRVISLRAEVNRPVHEFKFLEREIQAGFSEPYLAGIPLVARFNLSHRKEGTLPFDERSTEAKISLDKRFFDFIRATLQYSYDFRHIFRAVDPADVQKDVAASIGPIINLDFRDDPFNPSGGSLHSLSSFIYLPEIGSNENVDLVRTKYVTSWYFTPSSWLTLALFGGAGYARSFSDIHPIPVDLRFYLGGRATIRGFQEDEIGSDTKNKKIFENSFINYKAELRVPIIRDFGAAIFFDGGNVFFDDIDQPESTVSDFKHSFGPGLRYTTPIGPVSLDYGFRISKKDSKTYFVEPGRLHFSIGIF